MGGKALNQYGVFTERKNTIEFLEIGNEIRNKLMTDFPQMKTIVVKCYYAKESHGDLDLLICVNEVNKINFRTYIESTFNPKAINHNSDVYSFDYQNFQIDFILIKQDKWEIAQTFYNFDCTGNCMGKTFHKFNLSYGWDGLNYKFRNFNGTNSANILLTTDARKIFEFGGYDYDRYLQGFETLEDIFKFAVAGKYFDAEMFQMENLKYIDRKRNRKRGSYHLFLNYLKDNDINTKFDFNKNKNEYLPLIDSLFPDVKLLEQLNELKRVDDENKLIAEKFNGDIVMTWLPDLKGKELGAAITKFKNGYGEGYNDFILNSNNITIQYYFMESYNEK